VLGEHFHVPATISVYTEQYSESNQKSWFSVSRRIGSMLKSPMRQIKFLRLSEPQKGIWCCAQLEATYGEDRRRHIICIAIRWPICIFCTNFLHIPKMWQMRVMDNWKPCPSCSASHQCLHDNFSFSMYVFQNSKECNAKKSHFSFAEIWNSFFSAEKWWMFNFQSLITKRGRRFCALSLHQFATLQRYFPSWDLLNI